jgi:hypothetical protein
MKFLKDHWQSLQSTIILPDDRNILELPVKHVRGFTHWCNVSYFPLIIKMIRVFHAKHLWPLPLLIQSVSKVSVLKV